jgi:adenylate kinase
MTLIALTGVPGSGKSTICLILRLMNIDCRSALSIQGSGGCIDGDEVDTDCLGALWKKHSTGNVVIESHLSQLLPVDYAIILERSVEKVLEALKRRGYPDAKIASNIDSLLSGVIYSDAAEKLPTTRIRAIGNDSDSPYATAVKVASAIRGIISREETGKLKKEF